MESKRKEEVKRTTLSEKEVQTIVEDRKSVTKNCIFDDAFSHIIQ